MPHFLDGTVGNNRLMATNTLNNDYVSKCKQKE